MTFIPHNGTECPVAVKPLEWDVSEERWHTADTPFNYGYDVRLTDRGVVRWRHGTRSFEYFPGSFDEAKAAAQADYEQRVRSLVVSPAPEEAKPVAGTVRDWVSCPICGEPDMRRETDDEGESLITCVNLACPSNSIVAPSHPGNAEAGTEITWADIRREVGTTNMSIFDLLNVVNAILDQRSFLTPDAKDKRIAELEVERKILRAELGGQNADAAVADWREIKARAETAEAQLAALTGKSGNAELVERIVDAISSAGIVNYQEQVVMLRPVITAALNKEGGK